MLELETCLWRIKTSIAGSICGREHPISKGDYNVRGIFFGYRYDTSIANDFFGRRNTPLAEYCFRDIINVV